ncbi:MAG: ABC transporter ATP-binding protein [Deltaproteobacteria bacterium]|nr:ABC transporter ATP-binding protein [Deltaproteobacteria bacterium]
MPPLLEITGLYKEFGGLMAIKDLSFCVQAGHIKSLIGPNGAGKTTLFRMITGIHTPTRGEIRLKGRPVTGLKPHEIAALGIASTFQTVELFGAMTVLENVMVGRHVRTRSELFAAGLRLKAMRQEEERIRKSALRYLEAMGLVEKRDLRADALSLGEQKLLEVARALATEPELLLLDEPAGGLNDRETEHLSERIRSIRDQGVTVLLVEHDMNLVMNISDEIVVINYGEKIAEAPPSAIKDDQDVIDAYLGQAMDYSDLARPQPLARQPEEFRRY